MNKALLDFLAEMPSELWEGIEHAPPRPTFAPPGPTPPVHLRASIMGTAPPPTTSSLPPDAQAMRAYAEQMRAEEEQARLKRMQRPPF